jgi:hypothetical protein
MSTEKPNGTTLAQNSVACSAVLNGVELIRLERVRQITKEGWTTKHDDGHTDGELAIAGACYAVGSKRTHVRRMLNSARGMEDAGYIYDYSKAKPEQISWPWEAEWYKPGKDRIRQLVKAGALIAAEIDRLKRASASHRTKRIIRKAA